jgi:hypothetical protein
MRLVWLLIGVLITVGIFILFPGIFQTLVSWVESVYHWVVSFVQSNNSTNLTA